MKIFLTLLIIFTANAAAQTVGNREELSSADSAGRASAPAPACTVREMWEILRRAHEEFVPAVNSKEEPELKRDANGQYFLVHPRATYLNEVRQIWEGNVFIKGIPYGATPEQLEREAEEKKKQAAILRRRIALAQEIQTAITACRPPAPPSAPQDKQ